MSRDARPHLTHSPLHLDPFIVFIGRPSPDAMDSDNLFHTTDSSFGKAAHRSGSGSSDFSTNSLDAPPLLPSHARAPPMSMQPTALDGQIQHPGAIPLLLLCHFPTGSEHSLA
jgi:hypothetical protein